MYATFGPAMGKNLFTKEFKTHVKCIQLFRSAFNDEDLAEQFIGVLDLVIKWAFVKSFESSNTTFMKEILLFLHDMIDFCTECDYAFMDGEGTILITMLVEKTGINNAILKDKAIEILKQIGGCSELFPI
jgi:hypothetical protein